MEGFEPDPSLVEIMEGLEDRWRAAFLLRFLDMCSFRAIGEKTGIPWPTIKGWSQRPAWKVAGKKMAAYLASLRVEEWLVMAARADAMGLEMLENPLTPAEIRERLIRAIWDRTGRAAGVTVKVEESDAGAPAMHTPEGRAALVAELRQSIPPELLREALGEAPLE